MYVKKTYITGRVIEVEKYYRRDYPPGEKREKRKKPTPEQIKKINKRNQIKRLRRLINTNFEEGDIHLVLTYKKEERPTPEEAKTILKKFLRVLRREYKKRGMELKYVITTEWQRKAIHHHLIVNALKNENSAALINRLWERGRPKYTFLDDTGQYEKLAEYFIKEIKDPEEGEKKQSYSCSRNLIRPEPKIEKVKASSWKKKPKVPLGYVLKDITEGVSELTGWPYQYYTMVRVSNLRI